MLKNSLLKYLILLLLALESHGYDCYKFSKNEFATIKSCAFGCEYEFKVKGGMNQKESGGCAEQNEPPGCRQKGSKTSCACAENYCNRQGYDMPTSSEEQ